MSTIFQRALSFFSSSRNDDELEGADDQEISDEISNLGINEQSPLELHRLSPISNSSTNNEANASSSSRFSISTLVEKQKGSPAIAPRPAVIANGNGASTSSLPKTSVLVEEFIDQVGVITKLNCVDDIGFIKTSDTLHYFHPSEFKNVDNGKEFRLGDKVKFSSGIPKGDHRSQVTWMEHYVSAQQLRLQELKQSTTKHVRIVEIDEKGNALVSAGREDGKFTIEYSLLPTDYESIVGDGLTVKMKIDKYDEESQRIDGTILDVGPTKRNTISACTLIRLKLNDINSDGIWLAECKTHKIFVPDHLVSGDVLLKHQIKVVVQAIECRILRYEWRAISIEPSKHKLLSDYRNDTSENFSANGGELNEYLAELVRDKNGILINQFGTETNFGYVYVGGRVDRMISLKNTSEKAMLLSEVKFLTIDQCVAKFEIVDPQPMESKIFGIIDPGETFNVKISAKPLFLGETVEYMTFDFGAFKIGRKLHISCVSPEDKFDNTLNYYPRAMDQRGPRTRYYSNNKRNNRKEDYNKFVDGKREMIGRRTVFSETRAIRRAFFSHKKRILDYRIPDKVKTAYADNLAEILFEQFPSLQIESFDQLRRNDTMNLTFENYKDCFHVGLWLEEIDHENRLERLTTKNVILQRQSDNSMAIEISNPNVDLNLIQVGTAILVYDPAVENGEKYSAELIRITEKHMFARFSEKLHREYGDEPMTLKFVLPRVTYKRWHHAVEHAVTVLGRQWLFPTIEHVESRIPRLMIVEDNDVMPGKVVNDSDDTVFVEGDDPEEGDNDNNDANSSPSSSDENTNSRRIQLRMKNSKIKRLQASRRELDLREKSSFPRRRQNEEPKVEEIIKQDVKLKWFNTSLNEEQKNAVRRILKGQCRPLPFIVCGPAGTGKTITLIEAAMQINKLMKNSRLLITAPTNAAADLIAEYLADSGQYHPGDFIRLLSFSRKLDVVPEKIREYCQDPGQIEHVIRCSIVITTTSTTGLLFEQGLSEDHFSHVFIDEAASCTEPDGLIPALFVNTGSQGQLVLAGDHKQLGPIVHSDYGRFYGLGVSFLERLLETDLYKEQNELLVAKLQCNYRTPEHVLRISSHLFYDDALIPAAPTEETEELLAKVGDYLPRADVPLMFVGIKAQERRDKDSFSWYNQEEVRSVVQQFEALLSRGVTPNEIGIISAYKKQNERIRAAIEEQLQCEVPKIGSVDSFQGAEKKVIILSLVRSMNTDQETSFLTSRLKFVFSEKRINVSITRARCLQIIVGNPHLFCQNPNWRGIIEYCIKLGVFRGCNVPPEFNVALQQAYADSLRQMQAEVSDQVDIPNEGTIDGWN